MNFTRAAENLLLPQPAVSRYISALEKELGAQLFLRENSRKVALTEAGKAYYNLFQRTYLELDLQHHARSSARHQQGLAHAGFSPPCHGPLPPA